MARRAATWQSSLLGISSLRTMSLTSGAQRSVQESAHPGGSENCFARQVGRRFYFSVFNGRIIDPSFFSADALSTSALTHIMLDVSFQDAKKRSMLDIPETRDETFRTVLGAESVREGIRNGKIQLVLF